MERSSHYKLNRFMYVHLSWILVIISSYSIPFNLYRGETFWMIVGILGALALAHRAIKSSAIEFYEAEQRWLELDALTGGEKIPWRKIWEDFSLRELIRVLIRSRRNE